MPRRACRYPQELDLHQMTQEEARKRQTLKQAKASFKARGPTSVSAAERRRLERGAQLLERANRIKEQEQRKQNQLRKKEVQTETKDGRNQKPVLLGAQHKLDKFGYKSSQFHLGAFFTAVRPSIATDKQTVSPEPWDGDDVDDDTLLDIANESPIHEPKLKQTSDGHIGQDTTPTRAFAYKQPLSPVGDNNNLAPWDDLLESSTQIARELTNEKPTPQKPSPCFSSFGSTDFDWSAEDLEELDASLHCVSVETTYSGDSDAWAMLPPPKPQTINRDGSSGIATLPSVSQQDIRQDCNRRKAMPPPPKPVANEALDRKSMPPPSLPLQSKQKISSSIRKSVLQSSSCLLPQPMTRGKLPSDVSIADLELLAEEDIELTQHPKG
ncbi:hypothetical protein BDV97DRAFT_169280 [Delphinella strobiligena]|nr:hypothetical protein BDV97DRAFT_169280 [Delphinella strobiligena]